MPYIYWNDHVDEEDVLAEQKAYEKFLKDLPSKVVVAKILLSCLKEIRDCYWGLRKALIACPIWFPDKSSSDHKKFLMEEYGPDKCGIFTSLEFSASSFLPLDSFDAFGSIFEDEIKSGLRKAGVDSNNEEVIIKALQDCENKCKYIAVKIKDDHAVCVVDMKEFLGEELLMRMQKLYISRINGNSIQDNDIGRSLWQHIYFELKSAEAEISWEDVEYRYGGLSL